MRQEEEEDEGLNGEGEDVETLIKKGGKVGQVHEVGTTTTKNSKRWQIPNGCSILRVVEKWDKYM
jgi:hypothetical protein